MKYKSITLRADETRDSLEFRHFGNGQVDVIATDRSGMQGWIEVGSFDISAIRAALDEVEEAR